MPQFIPFEPIAGVVMVRLQSFADERGRFLETFRKSWFPQRSWEIVQTNRSDSAAGVLRGLHYHHRQVDYWYLARGRVRVGLADLRAGSLSHLATATIDLSEAEPAGLYIPSGVAHGFAALTDATLIYVVDNYYDGQDELGVRWDDPALGVDWGVSDPILSARDAGNPLLRDIPPEKLPRQPG